MRRFIKNTWNEPLVWLFLLGLVIATAGIVCGLLIHPLFLILQLLGMLVCIPPTVIFIFVFAAWLMQCAVGKGVGEDI